MPCAGQVVFVNGTAEGLNNGTSWANAYTHLTVALAAAPAGAEVWVARGVYRPGTTRAATFALRNEIRVYGGFAGDENPATFSLRSRDLAANETVLEGTLVGGSPGVHAYHVVTGSGTDSSAVLDGFTIRGGVADGLTATRQDVGAGMLVVGGSPTIRHCMFRENRAGTKGGAIHVFNGSPAFVSCRFLENETTVTQAGANKGGAVYVEAPVGNMAAPTFVNCLFSGNRAGVGSGGTGAAVYIAAGAYATFTNCTLVQNVADDHVGGVFGDAGIANSILWLNRDRGPLDRTAQLGGGTALVDYSCILGWGVADGGQFNIADDPQFADGDYRLSAGSPCLDGGLNEADADAVEPGVQALPVWDLDGNPRILGAAVDMGAYERCRNDADCTGGAGCAPGQCDATNGLCSSLGLICDDGLFCNGLEQCEANGCVLGAPPCGGMLCNETDNKCVNCLGDGDCDDGIFCNGPEVCADGACLREAAPNCDDGLACTVDECDESARQCVPVPVDAGCDDGLFCNGAETCDSDTGCIPGVAPCGDPLRCDEDLRVCLDCVQAGDCDDGDPCTQNRCELGTCAAEPIPDCCVNATECDDGEFCNGAESCEDGICQAGVPPCPDEETCDEIGRECLTVPPCTGDAECVDIDLCTDERCEAGTCIVTFNESACDDGNACTENDRCAGGVCTGNVIPGCGVVAPPPPLPPPDTDEAEPDGDGDGVPDAADGCPADSFKTAPGICGCGAADLDSDADGVPDCRDACPGTAAEIEVSEEGCPGVVVIDPDEPGTNPSEVSDSPPVDESVPDDPALPEDTPAEQNVGVGRGALPRPTMCGACGAMGGLGWSALALGLFSLRRRQGRPRGGSAGRHASSPAQASAVR